jgi:hypothetical protein
MQSQQAVDIPSMQQAHNPVVEHDRDVTKLEPLQAFEGISHGLVGSGKLQV